jgi:hypothetical protein
MTDPNSPPLLSTQDVLFRTRQILASAVNKDYVYDFVQPCIAFIASLEAQVKQQTKTSQTLVGSVPDPERTECLDPKSV